MDVCVVVCGEEVQWGAGEVVYCTALLCMAQVLAAAAYVCMLMYVLAGLCVSAGVCACGNE